MNNRKVLTIKQQEVLSFIDAYQKEHNVIPTLVEMAQKFGVTIPAIQHRIGSLVRRKVLLRENIYKILSPASGAILVKEEELKKTGEGVEDFKHIN